LNLFSLGAMLGFVGVAAGAFGAHALKSRSSPELLQVFETGARYQMYHALALLAAGLGQARAPSPLWTWAGALFGVGVLLFSGSLYLLALTGVRWLGALTPFGGLALLAGWIVLAIAALRL